MEIFSCPREWGGQGYSGVYLIRDLSQSHFLESTQWVLKINVGLFNNPPAPGVPLVLFPLLPPLVGSAVIRSELGDSKDFSSIMKGWKRERSLCLTSIYCNLVISVSLDSVVDKQA